MVELTDSWITRTQMMYGLRMSKHDRQGFCTELMKGTTDRRQFG